MMHKMLPQIILVANGLLYFSANAIIVEYVSSAAWDGVGFYISVSRDAIQKKLDLFHSSVSSECGEGPKLFLPKRGFLPDLQDNDQHPVYLDIGFLTSHDFDEYLGNNTDPSVAVSGLEFSVTIPFLAATSGGPPVHALALGKLYDKSRGDFPKTNFLYPYMSVDTMEMNNNSAMVRNGTEEIRLSFNQLNHPCKPPTSIVSKEFDSFVFSELQFGLPEPDFSFCDRHSFKSDYCTNAAGVRCDVHQNAPNVCQLWNSSNEVPCIASVEIQNITSGFRDFILVGNATINILASETSSGDYTVGLKFPCQDK